MTTLSKLIAPKDNRLLKRELSCSGFIMLLGVNKEHSALAHHNIFFPDDYRKEFEDIFTYHRPPVDPTIYAAITSKTDPSHAPAGNENWFLLINVPAKSNHFDWKKEKIPYRNRILEILTRRVNIDLEKYILSETILTPDELESENGAYCGALYGLSSNSPFAAFRRPHNRYQKIRGLYFAGGTTHPGGGVPMVVLSGKTAANMILKDQPY